MVMVRRSLDAAKAIMAGNSINRIASATMDIPSIAGRGGTMPSGHAWYMGIVGPRSLPFG
jgi:hypothetical protein